MGGLACCSSWSSKESDMTEQLNWTELNWKLNLIMLRYSATWYHGNHRSFHQIFWWSGQFSHSVVSDSLSPHGLQHARPSCPSPMPGAYSNSCLSRRWCNQSSHYCPLLLLPSIFPSNRVFPKELVLRIRWPKYWSFSFSISLSNEYSDLLSFRIDCYDLLAVRGTLENLLQHHSWKASILQRSVFFTA